MPLDQTLFRPGWAPNTLLMNIINRRAAIFWSAPLNLKMQNWIQLAHSFMFSKKRFFFLDLLVIPSCSRLCFPGEWQTRFDPQGTTKGAFYLDNQNSVSVDMMKSAQYPLRLLHDPELDALVMGGFTFVTEV